MVKIYFVAFKIGSIRRNALLSTQSNPIQQKTTIKYQNGSNCFKKYSQFQCQLVGKELFSAFLENPAVISRTYVQFFINIIHFIKKNHFFCYIQTSNSLKKTFLKTSEKLTLITNSKSLPLKQNKSSKTNIGHSIATDGATCKY